MQASQYKNHAELKKTKLDGCKKVLMLKSEPMMMRNIHVYLSIYYLLYLFIVLST